MVLKSGEKKEVIQATATNTRPVHMKIRHVETELAIMDFYEADAILHIQMKEGADMSIENTLKHYNSIAELTEGKPYFALIDSLNYYLMLPSALELASRHEVLGNRLATAHYNVVIANKLTLNFFKTNYKPAIPVKLFQAKEEAVKWLEEIKASMQGKF